MRKLPCPCGYDHDLRPIPDEGWATIKNADYESLLDYEMLREQSSPMDTSAYPKVVELDERVLELMGTLYECPKCGRILWRKPGTEVFRIFAPEGGDG